ncbi:hypothetical protein ABZ791_30540 [Streptomyces huasconensis]|uniref:WCX domain-containing protein n=1 Tax=Streptomyces huasconensis TaxID=1854574 RepID=A0ABV3M1U4_9ACTN
MRSTARLKVSRSARRGAGEADVVGRTEVGLDLGELPVAASDIVRLGLEAEVLGPPGPRAEVARSVTGLAQRYA